MGGGGDCTSVAYAWRPTSIPRTFTPRHATNPAPATPPAILCTPAQHCILPVAPDLSISHASFARPSTRSPATLLVAQLNIAYYLPSIPLLIVSAFLDKPLEARLGGCTPAPSAVHPERCAPPPPLPAALHCLLCWCRCWLGSGQAGRPLACLLTGCSVHACPPFTPRWPCLPCRRGSHHPLPAAAGPGGLWNCLRLVPLHA